MSLESPILGTSIVLDHVYTIELQERLFKQNIQLFEKVKKHLSSPLLLFFKKYDLEIV